LALRAVTLLIAVVVALSFLFGLGNVWALGLRLGVPLHRATEFGTVAPTVVPARTPGLGSGGMGTVSDELG